MLSGDRRGPSARRGMTVLGRIPAVPKPINLPSQRLENRGLDPNVEIVPRGGGSWGATGRSPPTINNAWGTTQASSPPLANGTWGASAKHGSNVGGSGAAWGGAVSRPSSAGSGTRPSSAGSIGQMHDSHLTQNAWGPLPSRPASASGTSRSAAVSGVQGHGQGMLHGQPHTQPSFQRPRSAEERHAQVSRPGEPANFPVNAPGPAWGGAGAETKMARDSHQPTAFQLTRLDFPTLGSEKSPDLRPQQGTATVERAVDEKLFSSQQQRPPSLSGPYDDGPRGAGPAFSNQERPVLDTFRREPFGGMPPGAEGNWHREEHRHVAAHDGHPPVVDSWRRDGGHEVSQGASPDENCRRGGPPVGPHGPHGHPRFQLDSSGFPPQQRYGPGPGPGGYGRGPGGFGPHVGNVYGNAGLLSRQGGVGRPGPPLGPGMYPGPPYDGAYGPPGHMDERGMMMGAMVMGGPGMYVGFPNRQGPPSDVFSHFHGSMGSGPRLPPSNSRVMREHPELVVDDIHDVGSYKDGRSGPVQDAVGNRRLVGSLYDASRPGTQGAGVGPHGLRDWGTSANEEPMDFSKPVFEEDASLEAAGAKKPGGVAVGAGGDAGNESFNRGNAAVGETARADDLKSRERDEDNSSSKDTVGGRSSGRPGRRAGSHENNGESGRVHRNKEPTTKEVAFSRDGEPDGFASKNHPSRKNAAPSDRGTVEVIAPRKEHSVTKDRPVSRDSQSTLQKANVFKGEDSSSASTVAGGGVSRPGQHNGTGRSSTSVNAGVLVAESTLLPTADSAGAGPADAGSVILDEKPKLLKRTSSGVNDAGSSVDTSGLEAAVPPSKEPLMKEDGIHKAKVVHDAEKEWRPKAVTVDAKPDGVSVSTAQLIKAPISVGTTSETSSSAAAQERVEPESDLSSTDAYDYDAQRAKMKEIAHQRSLQLQKEEEERSKEQKAKANAKLEELNRRTAGLSVPDSNVPDDLPKDFTGEVKREGDASGLLGQEGSSSNQSSRASGSLGGGRSGRNEHGKRERGDRKGSGRPREDHRIHSDSRDLTKVKLNSNPGQVRTEPPLLPSPSESNTSLQSQVPIPTGSQRSNGVETPSGSRLGLQIVQIPPKQQTSRHRAKHSTMQLKHGKDIEVPEVTEEQAVITEVVAVAAERNEGGGWSSGPHAGESSAVDSSSVPNAANRKKRNSRNSKSKQRADGVDGSAHVVHSSEHSDGADLIDTAKSQVSQQEVSSGEEARGISQESVKELSFQPLVVIEFGDSDLVKEFGVPTASPLSNGDSAGRRPQRKQQPVKRLARERTAQDVRVGDKSHSSDGLIWAPVRAAPSSAGNGLKPVEELASGSASVEKVEYPGTVHVSSSKPSDVESLKPVVKLVQDLVETGQSNASTRQPQHQACDVPVETRTVTGLGQAQVPPVASEPVDTKPSDNFSRSARSHASWRQRGSGNERGPTAKYHYQQDSRVGGKEGSVAQPSQDFRSSMGKGGGGHAQHHDESSSTHAQGDSGFKPQRADNHTNQPASRFPAQLNGQSADQLAIQRPSPPDQQAKVSTSQQKLATVGAKTEQLSSVVDGGSSGFHSSQQSPIPAAAREYQTYALVTPHHQPGSVNRSQVLSVTHEVESQSDHAKPHRASAPHGDRRPPSSSERHQRISGNQGSRVSDRELNGSRVVQQQSKSVSAHANRSRNFTSSSEFEKPSHGEQSGGYGDQPINERDRQRDQQHVKAHAPNNPAFKSVGHGSRGQVQGGDEAAMALNGSSQGARQQQGPTGSHDKEHAPHGAHQQFRPHQNFRQHGPMQDKDQPRDAAQHQRSGPSQGQWQQTFHEKPQSENRNYHPRSGAGRKNSQSSSDVEHHSDASKMSHKQGSSVNDHQSSASQVAGQQKVSQDRRQPSSVSGTQSPQNSDSNLHWVGESGSAPFVRGRDHGQSRRGRVVSRGGGSGGVKTGVEVEGKTEHAGPKRMVIDATGGAVPNLVAG